MGFLKNLLGLGVAAGTAYAAVKVAQKVNEKKKAVGEDLNGDGVVAPDVTRTDAEATAVELNHVDESATVEQEERE